MTAPACRTVGKDIGLNSDRPGPGMGRDFALTKLLGRERFVFTPKLLNFMDNSGHTHAFTRQKVAVKGIEPPSRLYILRTGGEDVELRMDLPFA